ncbi:YbdD/YjiX family protein [Nocardioides pakistanensis]
MRDTLFRVQRGVMWYLKQATGEAKWEEYLQQCAHEGREPMSRKEFERHRADHREANPQSRCC